MTLSRLNILTMTLTRLNSLIMTLTRLNALTLRLMFYLFICYFLQPFASIQNPHGFEFVVVQVFSDIHQW
jgi:hypothetical protein